jgi:hypothetical protein
MAIENWPFISMKLLGEYFDEREWQLDFHVPSYMIKKEKLMNANGFNGTATLKETMSSMYLSCTKYDRMYRECINTFGSALLTNKYSKTHADCNKIAHAFNVCTRNHQWFH